MQSALDSVLSRVILAVRQTTFVEGHDISGSSRLTEDLGLGRFGRLKLAIYLEEAFDLELPDEVIERSATIAELVRYFSKRCFSDGAFVPVSIAA